MSKRKKLTPEEIAEIRELRAAGTTVVEVAAAYGVAPVTISRVAPTRNRAPVAVVDDEPAPEPVPAEAVQEATKTCPHCGETLPAKARFCFMCGKVPKTEKEQVLDRLAWLASQFRFFPENARDEAIRTINAAGEFIQRAG